MSRWSWWAVGFGAYVAFTLATFPAGTALHWFAPAELTAAGVTGTLWSGSAASCSIAGFTAEALRWRVRPTSLLLGRIRAEVEARIPDGFVSGLVTASSSAVRFNDLRGATSLPALASVLPLKGMRGQASVALSELVLDNGWPATIVGELKLAGLETVPLIPDGSGSLLPLGDYTITFQPAPAGALAAMFVDNGGPLEVSGSFNMDDTRVYAIDALVEPRADAPETLVEGLKIMTGDPDAEGRRRLSLTGSL
ncbi:MAG TPA: type II secretion system protein N [Gammaproteobacteria bacterium]|nr:type II secretion system protein N [Gammaproteobacteria bacterium]